MATTWHPGNTEQTVKAAVTSPTADLRPLTQAQRTVQCLPISCPFLKVAHGVEVVGGGAERKRFHHLMRPPQEAPVLGLPP